MAFRWRVLRAAARLRWGEAGAFSHIGDRAVAGGGTLKLWLRVKSSSRLAPDVGGGAEAVNMGLRAPSALGEIIDRGARAWH